MKLPGIIAAVAAMAVASAAYAATPPANSTQAPDPVKTAVAVFVADVVQSSVSDLEQMGMEVDRDMITAAIASALQGKPLAMDRLQADSILTAEFQRIRPVQQPTIPTADPVAEKKFVDDAAARPDAVRTPSGLVVETLSAGDGRRPTADNDVVIRYRGTLSDGTVFDEVEADSEPLTFPVASLTPGLTEGLQLMQPGGRYRLTMPDSLAYGPEGIPGVIPGGAALCFEVELIDVK